MPCAPEVGAWSAQLTRHSQHSICVGAYRSNDQIEVESSTVLRSRQQSQRIRRIARLRYSFEILRLAHHLVASQCRGRIRVVLVIILGGGVKIRNSVGIRKKKKKNRWTAANDNDPINLAAPLTTVATPLKQSKISGLLCSPTMSTISGGT